MALFFFFKKKEIVYRQPPTPIAYYLPRRSIPVSILAVQLKSSSSRSFRLILADSFPSFEP